MKRSRELLIMENNALESAYQYAQARATELQRQAETIQRLLAECISAEAALKNAGRESLVPIGAGTFVPATTRKGSALIEVGSGFCLEATPEEAAASIAKKRAQLEKAFDNVQRLLEEASRELMGLEEKLSQ
ncbi:MAG: prefoldin subunit alpha [Candidatus Micrarchaeia archaeon]